MMKEFDKIIGYESIKAELIQLCDMIRNKERYEKLGAKLPKGIMLHGEPGLGKTLMVKCFIKASGLEAFTIRRTKGTNDFVKEITDVFAKAKTCAPCIIFLDDMDKFANEDDMHTDANEYVAVQSGIDELDGAEVVVIATLNDYEKLPPSLYRAGRFDRRIEVLLPSEKDSRDIIKHYLGSKQLSPELNYDDITKMISYSSCAELETIMNEAAINAGFAKRESISIEDIVDAVLRREYITPDSSYSEASEEDVRKAALHEAGHLVVCEVLLPGSVGLVSVKKGGACNVSGFMRRCRNLTRGAQEVLVSLGGKAAVELYYSEEYAGGCISDIRRAYKQVRSSILQSGACGLGGTDVSIWGMQMSENMNARGEAIVHAELERYMFKAKDILLKNRQFLEIAAKRLLEKETLLHSDIVEIRRSVKITDVAL